tara:strand:+ start:593 stop:790 length:198 start_codon:yes stop_codon:yes gene_type:complete
MPYHTATKKPKQTRKKGELTQRQKDTLKRHSKHHTKKHIAEMTRLMKQGKTFTEGHKIAMKKVGK